MWNYETLMKLCPENKLAENYKEGVRIGIALNSRGDVIDHAVINELKTFIKNYNEQSAGHLNRGLSFKVRSYDFTTFYVDIPKESTLAGRHHTVCVLKLRFPWHTRFPYAGHYLNIIPITGSYPSGLLRENLINWITIFYPCLRPSYPMIP